MFAASGGHLLLRCLRVVGVGAFAELRQNYVHLLGAGFRCPRKDLGDRGFYLWGELRLRHGGAPLHRSQGGEQ